MLGKNHFSSIANDFVSEAAACDGSMITTTADGQDIVPGTPPTH